MDADALAEEIARLVSERLAGPGLAKVKALPTFREVADRWIEASETRDKPQTTHNKRRWLRVIGPTLDALPIDQVTREVLVALQRELSAGRKATTVNATMTIALGVLRYACKEIEILPSVPWVRKLRGKSKQRTCPRDVYETFLAADLDPWVRVAVLLAGDAGLRIGECLALRWDCVADGAIHVCESMWWGPGSRVTDTKNHQPRSVPTTRRLALALETLPRAGERVLHPVVSTTTVYRRIRIEALGHEIEEVLPHGLRHSYATELDRRGARLVQIRDLLGHQNVTVTSLYLHSSGDDLEGAVGRLDDDDTDR